MLKKLVVLGAVAMTISASGCAADYKNNPFGLVYDGAITANEPNAVNIHQVTYKLNGLDIAANVYTPKGYDKTNKYPTIVIAHPNGSVKEQTAGLYAQRLAELGYITIAADASYQGASGGEPRGRDFPANRVEDIFGMADYITQYPGVDTERLGLFGICGGGGYSFKAAQTDKRFKAVATLSMFDSGRVRRNGFQDSQLDSIQERLAQAAKARAQEAAGGEIQYAGSTKFTKEEAAKLPYALYREAVGYYNGNYAHTNADGRYPVSNLLEFATFDATAHAELINQPLLIIAGSEADTLYMAKDAYEKATGTKDKELYLVKGATHIQTYYVPEYVDEIVNKLQSFFGNHL